MNAMCTVAFVAYLPNTNSIALNGAALQPLSWKLVSILDAIIIVDTEFQLNRILTFAF